MYLVYQMGGMLKALLTCSRSALNGVTSALSFVVHRAASARLKTANFAANEADRGLFRNGVAARTTGGAVMTEYLIIALRREIGIVLRHWLY